MSRYAVATDWITTSSRFIVLLAIGYLLAGWSNVDGAPSTATEDITNSLGMKLVYVPPGTFTMGSPANESGRESQETLHEVELTRGFYLGAHEVTVGQFRQFVIDAKFQTAAQRGGKGAYGINASGKINKMDAKLIWDNPGFEQSDHHPVVNVSWSDARDFCRWLGDKERRAYRLPTEAEWEYACRAGTKTALIHGDDPEGLEETGNGSDATARARYPQWSIGIRGRDAHVHTAPVGRFKANSFGLFDMHGNGWEWCDDWYVPNSYSAKPRDRSSASAHRSRSRRRWPPNFLMASHPASWPWKTSRPSPDLPRERHALQTVKQGEGRPMRGGAWHLAGIDCRCANRYIVGLTGRYATGGFRVLCLPE